MAKTLKEKNQMECNKRARDKYIKANYKMITIRFKNEEKDAVDKYCKDNNVESKNMFFKEAILGAINYKGKMEE